MKNLIIFLITVFVASSCGGIASNFAGSGQRRINSPLDRKIIRLKGYTDVIDKMFTASARMHVDIYFELADAYFEKGLGDNAKKTLKKALLLDPNEFQYQIIMAGLEMADGEYEAASDRLEIVYNNCTDELIILRALDLSQQYHLEDRMKQRLSYGVPDRTLYLINYRGTYPGIAE